MEADDAMATLLAGYLSDENYKATVEDDEDLPECVVPAYRADTTFTRSQDLAMYSDDSEDDEDF
jgi:hypothetical protein